MKNKIIAFDSSFESFVGAPDVRGLGFARATLVQPWGIYRKLGGEYDFDHVDMESAIRVANHPTWWSGREGDMIVIDEESLDLHADDRCRRDDNHDQLIELLQIYRKAHPGNAIGYYRRMPQRKFFTGGEGVELVKWRERNKQFLSNVDDLSLAVNDRGLSAHVDRVFPSLYYWWELNSESEWGKYYNYAALNIGESAVYNKPIFAYLCPQMQDYKQFPFWSGEVWEKMLSFVLKDKLVDGVVIYCVVNESNKKFDENWDWWQSTIAISKEN